jgi:regulator of sigma E protease
MGPLDILLAILGISLLVIVHESGHYLVARAFKMRVLRYSIGFGPVLFKHKPKNSPTTFQICAIPFLAYVHIAGMNPHEEFDPDDPEIYPNKSLLARILTIGAGPVANYLAASVMVFALGVTGWKEYVNVEPMTVDSVEDASPAAEAGLQPGDIVREANGHRVRTVEDLIEATRDRAGDATVYLVERHGRRLPAMTITPREADGRGVIGVIARSERRTVPLPVGTALEYAIVKPFEITVAQVAGIFHMATSCDSSGLTGPVGMGKIAAAQAKKGLFDFITFLVLLSVALGFFNLLPFPALDGGRLMFLGYELVTRRRPNERFEAMVHTVGILFLLGVLVLVTFRDIVS